jgi:hypothetical protein
MMVLVSENSFPYGVSAMLAIEKLDAVVTARRE